MKSYEGAFHDGTPTHHVDSHFPDKPQLASFSLIIICYWSLSQASLWDRPKLFIYHDAVPSVFAWVSCLLMAFI